MDRLNEEIQEVVEPTLEERLAAGKLNNAQHLKIKRSREANNRAQMWAGDIDSLAQYAAARGYADIFVNLMENRQFSSAISLYKTTGMREKAISEIEGITTKYVTDELSKTIGSKDITVLQHIKSAMGFA